MIIERDCRGEYAAAAEGARVRWKRGGAVAVGPPTLHFAPLMASLLGVCAYDGSEVHAYIFGTVAEAAHSVEVVYRTERRG